MDCVGCSHGMVTISVFNEHEGSLKQWWFGLKAILINNRIKPEKSFGCLKTEFSKGSHRKDLRTVKRIYVLGLEGLNGLCT